MPDGGIVPWFCLRSFFLRGWFVDTASTEKWTRFVANVWRWGRSSNRHVMTTRKFQWKRAVWFPRTVGAALILLSVSLCSSEAQKLFGTTSETMSERRPDARTTAPQGSAWPPFQQKALGGSSQVVSGW